MKIYLHDQIFAQLEKLVASHDAFYRQEFVLDDSRYWIYNYRLASYTDFLTAGALEARGIMFEVDASGTPIRLAAWPQQKFFNLNENPSTMNLDLSKIKRVEVKADGSLMSTYIHNNQIRLKSKGSLFSEHCQHAMLFLDLPENEKFQEELHRLTASGYTVNLEWCAPQHRIVIGYLDPQLTVLNIRSRITGKKIPIEQFPYLQEIQKHAIQSVPFDEGFIDRVADMEGIEGFVVELESGLHFKIKTRWYLALHHTKDSVNSDRRLYEAVLSEASDDLRALFHDDPLVIKRIGWMEEFVDRKYNSLVKGVDQYWIANKDLIRKDYAIKGQKDLDKHQFRLAMAKYTGQAVDYKQYMLDHWKEFGIKDDLEATKEPA